MEKTFVKDNTWIVKTEVTDLYVADIYGRLYAYTVSHLIPSNKVCSGMFINMAEKGTDFDTFIEDCLKVVNICPICGKHTPIQEQKLVGFANRACPDCYPSLKAQIERRGWAEQA